MDLIIHAGFFKAGSTTLQHLMRSNADALLAKSYYFRPTSDFFANHFNLYEKLASGDTSGFKRLLGDQMAEAKAAGARTLVLSSESFSYVYADRSQLESFLRSLGEFENVTTIFVLRDLCGLLESYLKHNVSNGVSLGDGDLGNLSRYFIHILNEFLSVDSHRRLIFSLSDDMPCKFFSEVFDIELSKPVDRLNQWGMKNLALQMIIGQAVRVRSNIRCAHPNDSDSDDMCWQFHEFVTNAISASNEVALFAHGLQKYAEEAMSKLIDVSMDKVCDSPGLRRWDSLLSQPYTEIAAGESAITDY